MAVRLLTRRPDALTVHVRKLESLFKFERAFSSQIAEESTGHMKRREVGSGNNQSWLNIRAGIFGPLDNRMPLPGNVGTSNTILDKTDFADFSYDTSKDKLLECKVQDCPELLKRDLRTLFPVRRDSKLTVITLCQHTENDMSTWSELVEEERELLIETFVNAAKHFCRILRQKGFWADFIDPTSGRPYLGPFTNSTLFETDDRFLYLGFAIEDLGCCKVIKHKDWGANIFIGTIFTNAATDAPDLVNMIYKMMT